MRQSKTVLSRVWNSWNLLKTELSWEPVEIFLRNLIWESSQLSKVFEFEWKLKILFEKYKPELYISVHIGLWFNIMVFSATFNNITIISWRSVLVVVPGPTENHRPVSSTWQTLSHNVVSSTPCHACDTNSQPKGW